MRIFSTLVAAVVSTQAQAFTPTRPIEVVVHTGPGGGSDLLARAAVLMIEKEKLAPVRMIGTLSCTRPRQQQAVAIAVLAKPIEPPPRPRLVHALEPPPAVAHGIERLGLYVGEPQPRRDAPCIFGDGNRERSQAADRVRL